MSRRAACGECYRVRWVAPWNYGLPYLCETCWQRCERQKRAPRLHRRWKARLCSKCSGDRRLPIRPPLPPHSPTGIKVCHRLYYTKEEAAPP